MISSDVSLFSLTMTLDLTYSKKFSLKREQKGKSNGSRRWEQAKREQELKKN